MKQIGLGVAQYTQDYDEMYPVLYNSVGGNYYWFPDILQPYVKSYQIFICPSDKTPASWSLIRPPGTPAPLQSSYGTNSVGGGGIGSIGAYTSGTLPPGSRPWGYCEAVVGSTCPSPRLSAFAEVSNTISMAEQDNMNLSFSTFSNTDIYAQGGYAAVNCRAKLLHFEGMNFLFLDGHVKWLKESKANMWTIMAD